MQSIVVKQIAICAALFSNAAAIKSSIVPSVMSPIETILSGQTAQTNTECISVLEVVHSTVPIAGGESPGYTFVVNIDNAVYVSDQATFSELKAMPSEETQRPLNESNGGLLRPFLQPTDNGFPSAPSFFGNWAPADRAGSLRVWFQKAIQKQVEWNRLWRNFLQRGRAEFVPQDELIEFKGAPKTVTLSIDKAVFMKQLSSHCFRVEYTTTSSEEVHVLYYVKTEFQFGFQIFQVGDEIAGEGISARTFNKSKIDVCYRRTFKLTKKCSLRSVEETINGLQTRIAEQTTIGDVSAALITKREGVERAANGAIASTLFDQSQRNELQGLLDAMISGTNLLLADHRKSVRARNIKLTDLRARAEGEEVAAHALFRTPYDTKAGASSWESKFEQHSENIAQIKEELEQLETATCSITDSCSSMFDAISQFIQTMIRVETSQTKHPPALAQPKARQHAPGAPAFGKGTAEIGGSHFTKQFRCMSDSEYTLASDVIAGCTVSYTLPFTMWIQVAKFVASQHPELAKLAEYVAGGGLFHRNRKRLNAFIDACLQSETVDWSRVVGILNTAVNTYQQSSNK